MATLPLLTVTPATAAQAYRSVETGAAGSDFGGALARALNGAVQAGHAADAEATKALTGGANITDVVAAVSQAELALQTTAALRDRVVQAYQDIMRMPI
jgi:flagellar hook-basal body complex protein FliE